MPLGQPTTGKDQSRHRGCWLPCPPVTSGLPSPLDLPWSRALRGVATGGIHTGLPGLSSVAQSPLSLVATPPPQAPSPASEELSSDQRISPWGKLGRWAGHCPLCPCGNSGQGRLGGRTCYPVTTDSSGLSLHQPDGGIVPAGCCVGLSDQRVWETEGGLRVKDHPPRLRWGTQEGLQGRGLSAWQAALPLSLHPLLPQDRWPLSSPCLVAGGSPATASGCREGHRAGGPEPPLWT